MKRTALALGAVGTALLSGGVYVATQTLRRQASGPDGDGPEPSRCLSEATIQVTATSPVTWPDPTLVKWSVGLPNLCGNVRVRLNGESVGTSGRREIIPARSSIFTVTVSETHLGVFGEKSASANVAVSYPPRVVIDGSTQSPVAVLLGALESANPEQTVELCEVDLDLTGHTNIGIGNHRSLIASPACARSPRRLGPRIFITDERGRAPLFVIDGDNVLVSGFRLEGPTNFMAQGDRKEKGIVVSPVASADPIRDIEISNMEVFHWSGLGIQVVDNAALAERGRLFNTNERAVRIRGSFFHHNRHGAGEGYGAEVSAGGYALIEQNVFDENRHGIAGGSRNDGGLDYSGYTARENLILARGGLHCVDRDRSTSSGAGIGAAIGGIVGGLLGGPLGAGIGAGMGAGIGALGGALAGLICWRTHQIDMHGDQNRFYSGSSWACGTAGETMMIERNTILYTKGDAIKIRGNPADKVVVDGNVFKHDNRRDAISQNGACGFGDNISKPIDVRPNNVFHVDDPTAELGMCDFFGDGQQDEFMATGVTWWAKSPVTGQWRYLNTMKEKLPELQLVKVDGDAVCDVAPSTRSPEIPPEKYSKSGTSPWLPLNVIVQ